MFTGFCTTKKFGRFSVSWLAIGLLLVVATAVRVRGAWNDLWLDEIWSLKLAGGISSPLGVFSKIHQDNNHYLNTLWIYFCGFRGDWPGYRIPSIVAGVGSVLLAGMIGRRWNVRAGWFAMLLVAFSYVEILYSSEVRGYAMVVFFSFFSFYQLEKFLQEPGWFSAALFSIGTILGFASQLIFVNFFCAAFVWAAWHFFRSGTGITNTIQRLAACFAVPVIFLVTLYFLDLRHLAVLGGSGQGPVVYLYSLAWTFGGWPGRLNLWLALPAIGLLIAGAWILRREKIQDWIFFVGVVVVFPILLTMVRDPESVYVRHFIVGMSFLLLLFGVALASLSRGNALAQFSCVILIVGFVGLNGWHTLSLFKYGRGQSWEAARFLADHTKGPLVTVGGDHDFRIGTVIEFYAPLAVKDKAVKYYVRKSWPRGGPEWFIAETESVNGSDPPGEQVTDENGNTYEWVKTFPSAPLSGLHWFVCHNMAK